jgi:hypothetical protein
MWGNPVGPALKSGDQVPYPNVKSLGDFYQIIHRR